VWMVLAMRYSVTRERHAEIRRALDARHAADVAEVN
jgi:Na+/melibiose symporter-like transporter